MLVMKLEGLMHGWPTAFDGQYLLEYDPDRDGVDPDGQPMMAHIVTTPNKSDARRFDDLRSLTATWKQIDQRSPMRADGRPNRPLTAFTISAVKLEDAG